MSERSSHIKRIAILGSYVPRRCGLATFSADLAESLFGADSNVEIDVLAMTDRPGHDYPDIVKHVVAMHEPAAYDKAANFLNAGHYDVLAVQHEYGIYGGVAGDLLLGLLRDLRMPVVTTLHTVLKDPTDDQRRVMDELVQLSERIVVMSELAVQMLMEIHRVDRAAIDLIPHGVPCFPPSAGIGLKQSLGIKGPMILTFGLISPDKGIQHAIRALPAIVSEFPDAVYVVLGQTHPGIIEHSGESYRNSLIATAQELGVERNLLLIDRYASIEDLIEFLATTDYYITPYLNPIQIASGTLAYAVGAGTAVLSTPYLYAKEILGSNRGRLVPFADPKAISDAILRLERDPAGRDEMKRAAAEFGVSMQWSNVGASYLGTFATAQTENLDRIRKLSLIGGLSLNDGRFTAL